MYQMLQLAPVPNLSGQTNNVKMPFQRANINLLWPTTPVPGAHPTDGISIEFDIRSKFAVL